jgi:hypothetical protein
MVIKHQNQYKKWFKVISLSVSPRKKIPELVADPMQPNYLYQIQSETLQELARVSALDFPDLNISNPHQILSNNFSKILKINLLLRERSNKNNLFMSSWLRASNST